MEKQPVSKDLLSVYDYEHAAGQALSPATHTYYAGGSADNLTRDDNRAAFNRIRLLPRMLRDVSNLSAATQIADTHLSFPLLLAPSAMNKLAHPDGELGMGRAAKRMGIVQVLSTMSTTAVEEVTAIGHDVWFQLYVFRDRAASAFIVKRAEAAGCKALVLTVDVPRIGLRTTLARSGFRSPDDMPFPNLKADDGSGKMELITAVSELFDPSLTWEAIEWLRSVTSLPIWVKGILRPDDARLAVDAGVDGIIVSNHGGRQLDTAVASIDALPGVVKAVGNAVPVMVDGGIRRGSDILKALALGASATLVGRPPLWGLVVEGEAGVYNILSILKNEFENVMAQCGCASVAAVTGDLIL